MILVNNETRTGVLGKPTNKFDPEGPGKISASLSGNSSHSVIKSVGSTPFGNSNGQNGAEIHWGTIRVPFAAAACA